MPSAYPSFRAPPLLNLRKISADYAFSSAWQSKSLPSLLAHRYTYPAYHIPHRSCSVASSGNVFLPILCSRPLNTPPHLFNHVDLVPRRAQRKPSSNRIMHVDRNSPTVKVHPSAEKPWHQWLGDTKTGLRSPTNLNVPRQLGLTGRKSTGRIGRIRGNGFHGSYAVDREKGCPEID